MIAVSKLGKHFAGKYLFAGFSQQFQPSQCYGIVGANGSGKSTLLRILTGEEEASEGECIIPQDCRIGALRQDRFRDLELSILHTAMKGDAEVFEALMERDALLVEAEKGDFDTERYGEVEELLQLRDGYSLGSRASEILEGLGIPADHHEMPLSTLSGGFQLRVLLAQTLTGNPDVLLLDEPTNHLDIISIAWLEKFIASCRATVVVVSHDQRFLNQVCTVILDVDYDTIVPYPGNYDQFVASKVAERERREKLIAKQEKHISEQEAFVRRFKAKATKARQAQSKQKQIDKIKVEKLPVSSRRFPRFKFDHKRPSGRDVLKVKGLCKSFDDKKVLHDVQVDIRRGDRVAVIGPNGIGKSTLLKILMGQHQPDVGEFEWGHEVAIGYFAQDHRDHFKNASVSALEYLWDTQPGTTTGFVRGLLGRGLFSGDDVDKSVGQLSGGEAARLLFCQLMGEQGNVMILDEPTNHLDLESIKALIDALKAYEGTLVFVSHDRHFVASLATRVVELKLDGVDVYNGTYDEFLAQKGDDHLDAEAILTRQKQEPSSKSKSKSKNKKNKNDSGVKKPGRQKLTRELQKITENIAQCEAEIEKISQLWSDPTYFTSRSNDEIKDSHDQHEALKNKLEALLADWERLEQELTLCD